MSYETILFEINDGMARLTLNRPEKLNSFTVKMHEEIRSAFTTLEADHSVRVLLITGAGRGFCAGQDLSDVSMTSGAQHFDLAQTLEQNYNPLLKRMRALPYPIVCAVNGVAAGAGCNFALAADIVIAAKSASFIEVFSRIGLIPDAGGTYVLPRLVGTARAMALSMLTDPVSAQQAQDWGMIWKCVPDEHLQEEVTALLRKLRDAPTKALGLIKRAIYASLGNNFETQLSLEANLQREAGTSADYKEGVAAFLEKRPAKFSGH